METSPLLPNLDVMLQRNLERFGVKGDEGSVFCLQHSPRGDNLEDYYQAARRINSSKVDVVSLQHEFGLFGGPDGIYIKAFIKHVEKPVVLAP